MWIVRLSLSLLFPMAALLLPVANATTLGTAQTYNVFVFGNHTWTNSDAWGRVAVGGTTSYSNVGVNTSSVAGTGLTVGNALNAGNGQVYSGGAVYGTTKNIQPSFNVIGGVSQGQPIDFLSAALEYQTAAAFYANETKNAVTGTTNFQYGGLSLTGALAGLNVFDINGANLSAASSLSINAPVNSTVLINVSGTSNNFRNMGVSLNGVNRNNVLFNFYESTALNISGISVQGSVLAPNAAVTFSNGNLEGTLIAKNLSGSGEFHWYGGFAGNLPGDPGSPVPEPGTWAMIGGGLIAVAAWRRRRSAGRVPPGQTA